MINSIIDLFQSNNFFQYKLEKNNLLKVCKFIGVQVATIGIV